jgi:glycosyltransferase involved in cell wall biosynthesis
MEQDYKNLEIIPVDDGSPDDCGAILDRLAAEDSRVKPIHKQNGGAASARNVGIDAATGQFICFVDSDDLVESSFISHLLETLLKYNADISVCGFLMWGQQTLSENPCKPFCPDGLSGVTLR